MAEERLQRVIARAGVASRRAAEQLITSGRVRVNGTIVQTLGTKVSRRDRVEVDGRRLVAEAPVYLVLNKPRGVVSTVRDPEGRATVRDLLGGVAERIFPVGRLDYHTSGVLLLTNDGDFCDALLHPKRRVPKTYVAKVAGEMREADRRKWAEGVDIGEERSERVTTGPADVRILRHEGGKTWLEVTIAEGRNQQIRRMGEATGFAVMRLSRTSFAGVGSDGLKPGEYRPLALDELRDLRAMYGVPRHIPRGEGAAQPQKARPNAAPGERTGPTRSERRGPGAGRGPTAESAASSHTVRDAPLRRRPRGRTHRRAG
jgi:23S rRNA pseudouridine2605 synthase